MARRGRSSSVSAANWKLLSNRYRTAGVVRIGVVRLIFQAHRADVKRGVAEVSEVLRNAHSLARPRPIRRWLADIRCRNKNHSCQAD
jgi:hypothetical protein